MSQKQKAPSLNLVCMRNTSFYETSLYEANPNNKFSVFILKLLAKFNKTFRPTQPLAIIHKVPGKPTQYEWLIPFSQDTILETDKMKDVVGNFIDRNDVSAIEETDDVSLIIDPKDASRWH